MWRVQKGLHHSTSWSYKVLTRLVIWLAKAEAMEIKSGLYARYSRSGEMTPCKLCTANWRNWSGEIIVPTYNWQGLLAPFFK